MPVQDDGKDDGEDDGEDDANGLPGYVGQKRFQIEWNNDASFYFFI